MAGSAQAAEKEEEEHSTEDASQDHKDASTEERRFLQRYKERHRSISRRFLAELKASLTCRLIQSNDMSVGIDGQ